MCGIAGFWRPRADLPTDALRDRLTPMTQALEHRGPDDSGSWIDATQGIALGHRRLSIIDTSATGHQPMASASGRYWIVFNGEIYNFKDLRGQLEAQGVGNWRSHSDTEILLEAIALWGVRETLTRTVGMFAFALWDRQEKKLTLARDRLGEKPLYYGWHQGQLIFASQLKALRALPGWSGSINPLAVSTYLYYGYIPGQLCVYQSVHKLAPGHYLTLDGSGHDELSSPYWSVLNAAQEGIQHPLQGNFAEWSQELERRLCQAIAGQMIADVPLGAFLSGGIDSSLVVALMQAQSARPVKTFTIGFHEAQFNEAGYAAQVARHLGTEHTEMYVSHREAMDVIPQLPSIYDEPFADSSQIPTILVSRLARKSVTVSLSGDGGDELFAGYGRYTNADLAWRRLSRVPHALRAPAANLVGTLGPAVPPFLVSAVNKALPAGMRKGNLADRAQKAADGMRAKNLAEIHERLVARWAHPDLLLGPSSSAPQHERRGYNAGLDPISSMMASDQLSWLPDDVLAKLDRAGMSASLESRVPLLDHRIVELAWQLPLQAKLGDGQTKRILRHVLGRYVPLETFDRPKQGFSLPIGDWLRGPLREWAENLLSEKRLQDAGTFRAKPVRKAWQAHLSGRRDMHLELWSLLMFQAWQEKAAA